MTATPDRVVATGAELLADAVAAQAVDVARVDWRPPMPGTEDDLVAVAADPRRRDANARALAAVLDVTAHLVDVAPAGELLGLEPGQFLHAGPPIGWDRASGPLRGALMGAAALEGLVDDPEDAVALFEDGRSVSLEPCHHRGAVGPMAGVVTPSMWMFVLEDRGHRPAYPLHAQRGARQGAALRRVLPRRADPAAVDGRRARPAAAAGGACRPRRHRPGRRDRDPHPDAADGRRGPQPQPRRHPDAAARPLPRPGRRAGGRPAPTSRSACGSSAATTTSSSTSRCRPASSPSTPPAASTAPRWWSRCPATAPTSASRSPAPATSGSPVPPRWPTGSTSATTAPTTPTPTSATPRSPRPPGIGGFAMATAPAIVRFVGGTVPDALATTRRMHEITLGENPRWSVPVLDFRGTPTGIDVTPVCRTGILPQINTGMAGRVAGRRARSAPGWSRLRPRSSRRRSRGWRSWRRQTGRKNARLRSTLPEGRIGVASSR